MWSTHKIWHIIPSSSGCGLQIAVGQVWHNELGSTMEIQSADPVTGVFGGIYNSLVGDAERWYVLTGRQNTDGTSVGWTVNWQNSFRNAQSVTTWSGQQQLSGADLVIITTWLLTSETTPDKDWKSTLVGFDHFSLQQPSPETKERAKIHCRRSHPENA